MQDAPYRQVPLRGRGDVVRAQAIVDAADYDWLASWHWHMIEVRTGLRYARGGPENRTYMHRLLMGATRGDGQEVDHRDGDGLNNRRSNLRVVTHAINQQNMHVSGRGRKSAHRGVTHGTDNVPAGRPWIAFAGRGGRFNHLGYHATELDAAAAAAQWRDANMPGTIEDPVLLARSVPEIPPHAATTRLHERAVEIEVRWKEDQSMQEIADALGITRNSLGSMMTRLRARGYDLPHRRAGFD